MIRTLSIALLLLLGTAELAWADRILEQPEDAFELALSDVIFPGSASGTLIFKTCRDCNPTSMRVDGSTSYLLNGHPVTLDAFSRGVDKIRQTSGGNLGGTVYVFFDVKTKHINRLGVEYVAPRTGRNTRTGQEGR